MLTHTLCSVPFLHCIMLPLVYSVWLPIQDAPVSSVLYFLFSYSSPCACFHIIPLTAISLIFSRSLLQFNFVCELWCTGPIRSFLPKYFLQTTALPHFPWFSSQANSSPLEVAVFFVSMGAPVVTRRSDALNLVFQSYQWPAEEPKNSGKIN